MVFAGVVELARFSKRRGWAPPDFCRPSRRRRGADTSGRGAFRSVIPGAWGPS